MSEGYSTIHSSRDDKTRPDFSGNGGYVLKPVQVPRSYNTGSGSGTGIKAGQYVYPKPGETVFFYEDTNGERRIMSSRNQVNNPSRTGTELVGTSTGRTIIGKSGAMIEVNWINAYINHNLLKADERVSEPRIGWVFTSKVDFQAIYQSPEDKAAGDISTIIPPNTGAAASGIDTTTLGFGAIAAALIFSRKKGKKK